MIGASVTSEIKARMQRVHRRARMREVSPYPHEAIDEDAEDTYERWSYCDHGAFLRLEWVPGDYPDDPWEPVSVGSCATSATLVGPCR